MNIKNKININDIQIRDPFIVPFKRRYYLYGSTDTDIWNAAGQGFNAYVSDDLITWEGAFKVFTPPENYWGTRNFWAPEVHVYKDEFYMFASFIGEDCKRGTAVLKSESLLGNFIPWSDGAVTPREHMCLDGTLYIAQNNQPWLVYCHEWVQTTDGTVCAIKLSGDLKKAVSRPLVLFKSSGAFWSKTVYSKSNKKEGYVTDGCFLHRNKTGELIMLWSCFTENGYCQCYAVSDNGEITGKWEQREVIYNQDGGHGMLFRGFDERLFLTLHTPNATPNERVIFMEAEEIFKGVIIK